MKNGRTQDWVFQEMCSKPKFDLKAQFELDDDPFAEFESSEKTPKKTASKKLVKSEIPQNLVSE